MVKAKHSLPVSGFAKHQLVAATAFDALVDPAGQAFTLNKGANLNEGRTHDNGNANGPTTARNTRSHLTLTNTRTGTSGDTGIRSHVQTQYTKILVGERLTHVERRVVGVTIATS